MAQAERRVAECVRLGFTEILLPRQNLKRLRPIDGVRMTGAVSYTHLASVTEIQYQATVKLYGVFPSSRG